MSRLLDETPGPEDVDRVTDALVECATGDEFIERVRLRAVFSHLAERRTQCP
ncbi:MAG: hypothetical protein OXU64_00690 [Gemmatimonadota bacterium]|nr:hypothetical protein [Gemmatimonadota bacterium]